jgi:hypothetical protein
LKPSRCPRAFDLQADGLFLHPAQVLIDGIADLALLGAVGGIKTCAAA